MLDHREMVAVLLDNDSGMLQALESLNLSWTSVEDTDMASIGSLNRLTALYLNHQSARSDISNLGLAELAQMSSLRRIWSCGPTVLSQL